MSKKLDKSKMIVEETHPQGVSVETQDRAHERRDVNVRGILISIGVLLGGIAVVMVIVLVVFNVMEGRREKQDAELPPTAEANPLPPAPRLQPMPPANMTEAQDLAAMRGFEDSLLTTYGWVDKPNGIARIPVDSAIAIIATKGTAVVRNAPGSMGSDTTGRVAAPIDSVGAVGIGTNQPPGAALEKADRGK